MPMFHTFLFRSSKLISNLVIICFLYFFTLSMHDSITIHKNESFFKFFLLDVLACTFVVYVQFLVQTSFGIIVGDGSEEYIPWV